MKFSSKIGLFFGIDDFEAVYYQQVSVHLFVEAAHLCFATAGSARVQQQFVLLHQQLVTLGGVWCTLSDRYGATASFLSYVFLWSFCVRACVIVRLCYWLPIAFVYVYTCACHSIVYFYIQRTLDPPYSLLFSFKQLITNKM